MNTRPLTLIVAIVLLLLLSLLDLSTVFYTSQHLNFYSVFVYAWSLVFGGVGLIGVFGLWKLNRWGLSLSNILAALALLSWATILVLGLVRGDTMTHMGWAVALTVCYALILVLVTRPASRQAFAPERVGAAA